MFFISLLFLIVYSNGAQPAAVKHNSKYTAWRPYEHTLGVHNLRFLKPSVTMILILVEKVANWRLISGEDLFLFLEIITIWMQKVANQRLISGEDLFFRDHHNFGVKGKYRIFLDSMAAAS